MELVEGREQKGDEILLRATIKTYFLTGRNVGNYLP